MTKTVRWTGRDGKQRCGFIHQETQDNPESLRNWARWNGYDLDTDEAGLLPCQWQSLGNAAAAVVNSLGREIIADVKAAEARDNAIERLQLHKDRR